MGLGVQLQGMYSFIHVPSQIHTHRSIHLITILLFNLWYIIFYTCMYFFIHVCIALISSVVILQVVSDSHPAGTVNCMDQHHHHNNTILMPVGKGFDIKCLVGHLNVVVSS